MTTEGALSVDGTGEEGCPALSGTGVPDRVGNFVVTEPGVNLSPEKGVDDAPLPFLFPGCPCPWFPTKAPPPDSVGVTVGETATLGVGVTNAKGDGVTTGTAEGVTDGFGTDVISGIGVTLGLGFGAGGTVTPVFATGSTGVPAFGRTAGVVVIDGMLVSDVEL